MLFIFEREREKREREKGQRESQSMIGGETEREGDTESVTGSRLRAISPEPDAGLELTDREIVTWLKSDA